MEVTDMVFGILEQRTQQYCVYILSEKDSNLRKIGRSRKLHRRLSVIYAFNPHLSILVDVIVCPDWRSAIKLEKYLHNISEECRVGGEWFEIDDAAYAAILEYGLWRVSEDQGYKLERRLFYLEPT